MQAGSVSKRLNICLVRQLTSLCTALNAGRCLPSPRWSRFDDSEVIDMNVDKLLLFIELEYGYDSIYVSYTELLTDAV